MQPRTSVIFGPSNAEFVVVGLHDNAESIQSNDQCMTEINSLFILPGGNRQPGEGELCGLFVRGAHPLPEQGALPLHPQQEGAPRPQDHHRHLQHRRQVLHRSHQQVGSK